MRFQAATANQWQVMHRPTTALFRELDARLIGIDLRWMIHVQGGLEIAKQHKAVHPGIPIIFGGISSTYYATQLMEYPFVDMVMRGYDTHIPMDQLLAALREGSPLHRIANLLWKSADGEVVDNGFAHAPDTYACGIDWTTIPQARASQTMPILEVLSTQNAGCAYNCGWCGGSREAFRRIFKRQRAMARKPLAEVAYEFKTMSCDPRPGSVSFLFGRVVQ